jgi:hypothetical protein
MMPAADYGVFFSFSSLGLLLSRVLSFGAVDNLPTKIRGRDAAMTHACADLAPLTAVAAALTFLAAFSDSRSVAAAALALCMASGLAVAGAVRSVRPDWFERWLNLHPIILLGLALLLGNGVDSRSLLLCQAVSVLASQVLLLHAALGDGSPAARRKSMWFRRVGVLLSGGQSRMVSDTLIAACLRAVAVWPLLLGMNAVSDALALALALSEAVWALAMILVHRNFAYYCSAGPDLKHSQWSVLIILVGMVAGGLVGAQLAAMSGPVIPVLQSLEPLILVGAVTLFAGFGALSEQRYFSIAKRGSLHGWIIGQLAFLMMSAAATVWLTEAGALWYMTAAVVVASVGLAVTRAAETRDDGGRPR